MLTTSRYLPPDSESWRVHREVTVLFGGARALLMQAIHPLVIAGAGPVFSSGHDIAEMQTDGRLVEQEQRRALARVTAFGELAGGQCQNQNGCD